MKFLFLFLFLFVFYFVSCAETTQNTGPANGTLTGKCFTNNTCNDGLACVDNKCIEDKCKDKTCDTWMQCSQTTGQCDQLKDGYCLNEDDCNTEANEICKDDHTCGVKSTEVENCTPEGNECTQNTINTVCKEGKCVEPSQDLCENTDCSADINSECNPTTGNCECKTDFHLENGSNECLANQKEVNCKKPEIENSEYTIATVTINWKDNSWEEIPECKWKCKDDYYVNNNNAGTEGNANVTCEKCNCEEWQTCQEDGSCTLIEGKCETVGAACLSQTNENKVCDANHNCVDANNPCDGIDCGGIEKGECKNLTGTAVCICKDNYFDDGSLNCVNPCEGKTCSNHGVCEATTILSAHCVCNENYFPDGFNCISPCAGHWDCNTDSTIDDNLDNQKTISTTHSSSRGTCTADDINTPICACITGYEDLDNDLICTSVCGGVTCNGHGSCTVDNNGVANCNCDEGYAKQNNNSLDCLDIDECSNNLDNCDSHASCTNTLGSFTCTCSHGYTGNGVTCTPVDACNNRCETWEPCNQSTGICEPIAGRCNKPTDCSNDDCLIRKTENYTPISPNIGHCDCNIDTHRCEAIQ